MRFLTKMQFCYIEKLTKLLKSVGYDDRLFNGSGDRLMGNNLRRIGKNTDF